MQNVVSWFEIPVKKLDRAAKFYSQVLGVELQPMNNGPKKMMAFPFGPGVASGGLLEAPTAKPSSEGTLVYLAATDLAKSLSHVEKAGGKVLMPKTSIGDHGFIAEFQDTEGNRVALHSMN